MQTEDNKAMAPGLPLPRWCFVLLAVPTFFMPPVFVLVAGVAIGSMLLGGDVPKRNTWFDGVAATGLAGVYVTFVMWPVYLLWAALSKRLVLREKVLWLAIIVWFNMLGMPAFYIFMVRRYLGIEGRTGPRDEAALDVFLRRCKTNRGQFAPEQLAVLRSYCQYRRVMRWLVVPAVIPAILALRMAIIDTPQRATDMFVDMMPMRMVVIDKAKESRKEIGPEPESQRQFVQCVLLFGALVTIMGAGGVALLVIALSALAGNPHRKTFAEFIAATGNRQGPCPPVNPSSC